MTVELIYDCDCPNVIDTRANLLEALAISSREVRWTEWEISAPDSPDHVRGYGSPTILVDGRDVAGHAADERGQALQPEEHRACRLYQTEEGRFSGVPSVRQIANALAVGEKRPEIGMPARTLNSSLASGTAVLLALLPKVACPACWPIYAGILSGLGLGFLLDQVWLLPITASFLGLAVAALASSARSRNRYGPFLLGMISGAGLLIAKFVFEFDAATYVSIAGLVAASVWNLWPNREVACGYAACDSAAENSPKETS